MTSGRRESGSFSLNRNEKLTDKLSAIYKNKLQYEWKNQTGDCGLSAGLTSFEHWDLACMDRGRSSYRALGSGVRNDSAAAAEFQ